MTTDYTTTGKLAEQIREWATQTALETVDIEQVVLEALDAAESRADGETIHYELGARFTRSGRPEIFTS